MANLDTDEDTTGTNRLLSTIPSISPRRQGMVLLFLIVPLFYFLFKGAELSFYVKPPVFRKIQTTTFIEYDLYSIQMSLEYLRSQLARNRGAEPLSKKEMMGFLAQVDSSERDILSHPDQLSPVDQRMLHHLDQLSRISLERTILADHLSLAIQQTTVLEKRIQDKKMAIFNHLRSLDQQLYRTGIILSFFVFLVIGTVLYWIWNYWMSHRNLALYETLIHSRNGIAFVDRKTSRFLFVNDGFLELAGYSREELMQQTLPNLSRNLGESALFPVYEKPSKGPVLSRRFEFDLLNKSGVLVPVAMYVERSVWEGADILITLFYDRSEKKALEEKNRKILDHLDTIVKNIGEGLMEIDREGLIMSINHAAEVVLNETEREFLGKSLKESGLFSDDAARIFFESRIAMVLDSGMPLEDDSIVFIKRDGTAIEVFAVFSPISLEGVQEIMGVLVSFRNIGVRKSIERKLVESEIRYRKIVEGSPDGIYMLDPVQLILLSANNAFCRMMGYDNPDDVIGRPVTEFSRNTEEVIRENIKKLLASGPQRETEAFFLTRTKKIIPVSLNISMVVYQGSSSVLVTVRDIAFRKQWEGANAFFLTLDQMLLGGTSSLDFYHTITRDLSRIFTFEAVTLVIKEGREGARLRSISSSIPSLEEDLQKILQNLSGDFSKESLEDEVSLSPESHFRTLDHYPPEFQNLLKKYRATTSYYVPILSGSGAILGAMDIALGEGEDLSTPVRTLLNDIAHKLAISYLHQESLLKIRLLNKSFEVADSPMFITDPEGMIEWANPAYLKLDSGETPDVLGKKHPFFISGLSEEMLKDGFWHKLQKGETLQQEYRQVRPNGEIDDREIRIAPILDEQAFLSNLVCIEEDISDQKALEDRVYLDPLTGLYNRAFLEKAFGGFLSSARRYKRLVGLFFLDLDGFKGINDCYGHAAGDTLLITLSRRFEGILRGGDIAARVGGDEFVIVLNNVRSESEINQVAQRLLSLSGEQVRVDGGQVQVGMSVGVAIYPTDGNTRETLLQHADRAMYQAKQSGKNRIVFFHQMGDTPGEDPRLPGLSSGSPQG